MKVIHGGDAFLFLNYAEARTILNDLIRNFPHKAARFLSGKTGLRIFPLF